MNRMRKLLLIMAVVLMCLSLTACGGSATKVEMSQYLSVSYAGYNGNGIPRIDFDFADFEYGIMSQWKDEDKMEKLGELTAVEMTITYSADVSEGLSNGDTITVKINFDEAKAKEYGYSFTGLEKKFIVEGLTEAIEIDPFAEDIFGKGKSVDVTLEGIAPFVCLYLRNNAELSDPIRYITYKADKDWNLKNGEVITITASMDEKFRQQGYLLTATETTITVEGFQSYITDVSALHAEDVAAIREKVTAYWAEQKNNGVNIRSADGKQCNMSPEKVGFCSDLRFDDTGYAVVQGGWGTTTVLLIPFHADIQDVSFTWWGYEYYEDPLIKSFPNAAGYFAIKGLTLDENGQLIKEGSFNIEMTDFYESEQQLRDFIYNSYGMDEIYEGTFAS